jgi:sulfur-oxidizing protein SoxZ
MASPRALLNAPTSARAGEIIAIRTLIQHPMETGYRKGTDGQPLPRELVRRVECRFNGELVFAADLQPAVSANPYLAFTMRATSSGTIRVTWLGDNGFNHDQSVALSVDG